MGVSENFHQMDGGHIVDSEKKWGFSGINSLRSSPLKPVFTKPVEKKKDCDDQEEFSTTPTSAESRIPTRLTCPPAPKKRKPSSSSSSSRSCNYGGVREFFNPPDLEFFFMRRVEGA